MMDNRHAAETTGIAGSANGRATPPFGLRTLTEIAIEQDTSVGGKAYNLAVLAARGFPVPDAVALASLPQTDADWERLFSWWANIGGGPLAARSSARGEDSGQASFAGQLTSLIGIDSEAALKDAVVACFASIDRAASRAYREHFGHVLGGMNVLVQRMIDPAFSGVFFTRDPRGASDGWLVEAVRGFGESLVSGQETPVQFSESGTTSQSQPDEGWRDEFLNAVVAAGRAVKDALGFDADMEWAIDKDGRFWVLQARPITTSGRRERDAREVLLGELQRLQGLHDSTTAWDTQTFAEWTGLPTRLSLDIWRRAFSADGAFLKALREIGYAAEAKIEGDSLLESVFGRACLNLNRLQNEFFGKIPYTTNPVPRPHLEFDWRRIDLPTVLHAPAAIARMINVAWTIQSRHDEFVREAETALAQAIELRKSRDQELAQEINDDSSLDATIDSFRSEATVFATETLKWPFVLAILAESALNGLESVLAQDVGAEQASTLLRSWMGAELSTVTYQMDQDYQIACTDTDARVKFLETYGHRGPGELDLARKRWREYGDAAFSTSVARIRTAPKASSFQTDLEDKVHFVRRAHVAREWPYLKALLELRERWKMEVMKPYFALRQKALKIGAMTRLENDIFWLKLDELGTSPNESSRARILERKAEAEIFRKLALPRVFSLTHLEQLIATRSEAPAGRVWQGEALSPGLAFGTVRVVRDPSVALASEWPETTVLVAEATDPGWTPLFQRAVGVVVARGGVLSHCAIVAREMGLPAVSQIEGCTMNLKDGDHVWVDGNLGRVELAERT